MLRQFIMSGLMGFIKPDFIICGGVGMQKRNRSKRRWASVYGDAF